VLGLPLNVGRGAAIGRARGGRSRRALWRPLGHGVGSFDLLPRRRVNAPVRGERDLPLRLQPDADRLVLVERELRGNLASGQLRSAKLSDCHPLLGNVPKPLLVGNPVYALNGNSKTTGAQSARCAVTVDGRRLPSTIPECVPGVQDLKRPFDLSRAVLLQNFDLRGWLPLGRVAVLHQVERFVGLRCAENLDVGVKRRVRSRDAACAKRREWNELPQ
jgi:hypothetical protein